MSQSKSKLKRKLEGWVRPEEPERPRDDQGNLILNTVPNWGPNRKRRRQSEFWKDRTKSKKGAKHKDGSSVYYPDADPTKSNNQRLKEGRKENGRDI